MDRPRFLYLYKQNAQCVLQLVTHDRWLDSKNRVDVLDMLEIPIEPQLLQNLAHLLVIDLVDHVLDPLLLDSPPNRLDHMGRNLRRLFRLKLRQNLLEMVQTHISVVSDLVGRLFVYGLLVVHNILYIGAAAIVVANHNTLLVLRNQFAGRTLLAHIHRIALVGSVDIVLIHILPIILVEIFRVLVLGIVVHHILLRLDFEKRVQNVFVARLASGNLLFLLEIVEYIGHIVQQIVVFHCPILL